MGAVDRANLVLPRELPDGSVQWEEHTDIGRKLRDGDPTLGWEGDPSLSLVLVTDLDGKGPAWQLWQRCDNGEPTVLATRMGVRRPGDELIRYLVAHDTRRVDVVAMVDAHNARVDAAAANDASERNQAHADRLAFALGRDLDMPAQDGRVYPVGR